MTDETAARKSPSRRKVRPRVIFNLLSLIPVASLIVACGSTPPVSEEGDASPEFTEIPIEWEGFAGREGQVVVFGDSVLIQPGTPGTETRYVHVPVFINDQGPLWFMVDTGAGPTVISPTVLQPPVYYTRTEKAQGIGGEIEVHVVELASIRVGHAEQRPFEARVGQFPSTGQQRPVVGILGQDFLEHYRITIDYPEAVFIISDPE